jgi:hypothetical protein
MTEPMIKNRKNSIKLVKSLDQKIYKSYSPFTGNIKMMMALFVPFLGVLLFQQLVMVGGTCNSKLGRLC